MKVMRIPQHSCTVHEGKNTWLEEQTQEHHPTDDQDLAVTPFLIHEV